VRSDVQILPVWVEQVAEINKKDGYITLHYPIKTDLYFGSIVALMNVDRLLSILKQEIPASLTVNLLTPKGETIYNNAAFAANAMAGVTAHQKTISTAWGGSQWLFDWSFPEKVIGGADMWPGYIIFSLGLLLSGMFAWMVWNQQRMSARIQREVVDRTNELEQASRRFRMITDNAYDLISILSVDGRFEYSNSAYHRVLGYSRSELKDQNITQFVHPKDLEIFNKALKDISEGRNATQITFRMRHKKGNWIYLEAVAKSMHDNSWVMTNIVIHCRDITSRKQYADELARSEERFRDFADSSADWLWEVNDDFEFTYVSLGVKQTLGYTSDELIGCMKFDTLFDKNSDMTREMIENRVHRHESYRDLEFWTRSKGGERVCLRISGMPIFNEKQVFTGYRGVATNITSSKLDRENMYHLATTDHLTGLLNRARFSEELERTLSLSKRHKTQGVLLFIDLDQFKGVNDTYGHDAGDTLIKAVAAVLQDAVRSTDTVARLGGDEFGIIMHNIDIGRAKLKVQKIIDELDSLRVEYKGTVLHVTMSIGMVTYPQEGKDSSSLLMSADLAMYRAKDLGRNRVFFDEGNEIIDAGTNESTNLDQPIGDVAEKKDSLREQLKWVQRLRVALEDGDFEMHYQPLVPHKKSKRPYFEALIRLRDDKGNLGAPGIFIDAAEHFGLIQQLDMCVMRRCFEQHMEMKSKGKDIDISVNLSGKSLLAPETEEKIKGLIGEFKGLKPNNFTIEITETAALHDPKEMKDMQKIIHFVAEMKKLGFRLALDDFGTGFSSFNYIKHLDVDIVKVDGSFILPLENSEIDRVFVKAISDLTKGLKIKTVAEFVENEKILQVLDELDIDYAQGYHLSKPEFDLEKLYDDFKNKTMKNFE